MSNATIGNQLWIGDDTFDFSNIFSAGFYVYFPMAIIGGLVLYNIYLQNMGLGMKPVYIMIILGFLIGNAGFYNVGSWVNYKEPGVGRAIKFSGIAGYIGAVIGGFIGVALFQGGTIDASQFYTSSYP